MNKIDKLELPLFVVTAIVISFLLSYPEMILWNSCLVPSTSLHEVGWTQMWGIQMLITLIMARP